MNGILNLNYRPKEKSPQKEKTWLVNLEADAFFKETFKAQTEKEIEHQVDARWTEIAQIISNSIQNLTSDYWDLDGDTETADLYQTKRYILMFSVRFQTYITCTEDELREKANIWACEQGKILQNIVSELDGFKEIAGEWGAHIKETEKD